MSYFSCYSEEVGQMREVQIKFISIISIIMEYRKVQKIHFRSLWS